MSTRISSVSHTPNIFVSQDLDKRIRCKSLPTHYIFTLPPVFAGPNQGEAESVTQHPVTL